MKILDIKTLSYNKTIGHSFSVNIKRMHLLYNDILS